MLRSGRETGRYETGIRVGTALLAKLPRDPRAPSPSAVPGQSRGCVRRLRVGSVREAEPAAAGEPGHRPASDSAPPDLRPGYSWLGVCSRQAAQP